MTGKMYRIWTESIGYVAIIGKEKARGLTLYGDVRPEVVGRTFGDIASRMGDDSVYAAMHEILSLPIVDLFSRPPKAELKRAEAKGVAGKGNSGNWFQALGGILSDPLALSRFGYWPGEEWSVAEPPSKLTPVCSVTCEHAYAFDLVNETLDYYQGAQFHEHADGIFVPENHTVSEDWDVWPVRRRGRFPFSRCDGVTWRDMEMLSQERP